MTNTCPYSLLKENMRNYEIMLCHDQDNKSLRQISIEKGMATATISQIYHKTKIKQIRLYIKHIAFTLGCDEDIVRKEYFNASACYQGASYVATYFEKKYCEILTEYRQGEPGMPKKALRSLPPMKEQLKDKTIEDVIRMRDEDNATFEEIGKKCKLTRERARNVYESHYHKKVEKLIDDLLEDIEDYDEKIYMKNRYYDRVNSSKHLYDVLFEAIKKEKGK